MIHFQNGREMRWKILVLLIAISVNTFSQSTVAYLETPTRYISASLSAAYDFIDIPVQIKNEKILIEAMLDGESGYLILDTGAPGIIVNQKVIAVNGGAKAYSVNRELPIQEAYVEELRWGGIQELNMPALAVDLSHFEKSLDLRILGLIGFDVLKDYLIIIDYPARKLMVRAIGDSRELRNWAPRFSVPFELDQHVPIVEVEIDGRPVRMGMDTGTGSNLIDKHLVNEHFPGLFKAEEQARLQGLDQKVSLVPSGRLEALSVGGFEIRDEQFLLAELEALRAATGLRMDGLLGYEFFKNYRCAIDFANKRIYFW
jgi:hypothetical protein